VLLPRDGMCAAASRGYEFPGFDAYLAALASPDRDDIAALALTLGILCFAVVSAVLFLRTRRHLAAVEAAARDEALAAKTALTRCSCPNRKSWSPGRPQPTSRKSSAIRDL
jgi:hypothetical protein